MKTSLWLSVGSVIASLLLPSCLTQRTVSEGGRTVKQEYVIKRPISDALKNSR